MLERVSVDSGSRTKAGVSIAPAFMRRSEALANVPDAIIGNPIGAGKASVDYVAAKAGDKVAALRLAQTLVTLELLAKITDQIGSSKPIVAGVVSIEETGRNKLPSAAAAVIASKLGLELDDIVLQANCPMRTSMSGLDRIFSPPEFDGQIEPGTSYLLVDDTLTQGATFAAMASHIRTMGGDVAGIVALTGKSYSARIKGSPETLANLREKYSDLEPNFKAATGYGFDGLTQSEARYLANFEPAVTVRDRLAQAGAPAGHCVVQGDVEGQRDLIPPE